VDQVEKRKQKGADFARNVLKDDDLADSLESEDPYDYAERKHLKISNSPERRQASMANGNGGDDYDFTDWTKTDCTAALNQVAQIAEAAYDPMSSREDLAQALSDILDALGDGDDDDAADDGDDHGDDSDLD
jgi:hypothetical protein